MKRIAIFALMMAAASLAGAAQTVTLTGPTVQNGSITWTAAAAVSGGWGGCTAAQACDYSVYALRGASCPATIVGSAGWTEVAPAVTGTSFTDATEAAGTSVSYVVYTTQSGNQSGPSNCITVAYPFDPAPPSNVAGQG
jgi:hypothetical protein